VTAVTCGATRKTASSGSDSGLAEAATFDVVQSEKALAEILTLYFPSAKDEIRNTPLSSVTVVYRLPFAPSTETSAPYIGAPDESIAFP
jgi:hypothetical protein